MKHKIKALAILLRCRLDSSYDYEIQLNDHLLIEVGYCSWEKRYESWERSFTILDGKPSLSGSRKRIDSRTVRFHYKFSEALRDLEFLLTCKQNVEDTKNGKE